MTLTEALTKYPPKTEFPWYRHGNAFSAESSDFKGTQFLDPWNRPIPNNAVTHRDREGDATHWVYMTTVAGQAVELTVWND